MKIYLAGSLPKGKDEANTFQNWRIHYQKTLEKVFDATFIDPNAEDIIAFEGDSRMIVGVDCGHIKSSDLVVVNAEERLGAGTSQELVIAKYFGLPVIAVLPKDTHHRRSNITFHETIIEDWIHPFIDTFSDFVVERVEDVGKVKEQLESTKPKDISIVDEAIAYAQEKLDHSGEDQAN
jgi:hypothetical protein